MELQNLFYLLGGAGLVASIVLAMVFRRKNRFWITLLIISAILLLVGFLFIQSSLKDTEIEDVAGAGGSGIGNRAGAGCTGNDAAGGDGRKRAV